MALLPFQRHSSVSVPSKAWNQATLPTVVMSLIQLSPPSLMTATSRAAAPSKN